MPYYPPAASGGYTPVIARLKLSGSTWYCLPGVQAQQGLTGSVLANRIYYHPIWVVKTITLDQLALEVTTAGAAATTARMGIYNGSTDLLPTSLVLDAGTVAVDSTGIKTLSISQTLAAGFYFLAYHSDGAPTCRIIRASTPDTSISPTNLANFQASLFNDSTAYAPFAATAVAPNQSGTGNQFEYRVFCRVSVP